MPHIATNPANIVRDASTLKSGDTLELAGDQYTSPVFLDGIGGTAANPIIISSKDGACFSGAEKFEDARRRINRLVQRRQESGYFPSIGQTADEAWLILRNCRYVIIEGLKFEGCWPGSIYIDQSQNIEIRDIEFLGGTIAIGVNGYSSRDILIEDCTWRQDVSNNNDLWNTIPWTRVHGHTNNAKGKDAVVSVRDDYRLFDGDFFRAWEIPGNVTIRNNHIKDAFNGIHFFNRRRFETHVDDNGHPYAGEPNGAANVLIENNTFERIRDNIIEPEEGAWNWIIRYNAFLDFYRLFSLEMQSGGHFYVYGNVGWQRNLPGPKDSKGNSSAGSLLKLGSKTVGAGPFYFFHNSWMLEGRIASKNSIRGLHHYNNLVDFPSSLRNVPSSGKLFGDLKTIEAEAELLNHNGGGDNFSQERIFLEPARFTTRWESLGNTSDGDVIHHLRFPNKYREVGMKFGGNSINANPSFAGGDDVCKAFNTRKRFKSVQLTLDMPFGPAIKVPGNQKVGAIQKGGVLFQLPEEFRWLESREDVKTLRCAGMNPPKSNA